GLQSERYKGKILAVPHNVLKVDDQGGSKAAPFRVSTLRAKKVRESNFNVTLSLEPPFSTKRKPVARNSRLTSQPEEILEFGPSHKLRKFTDQLNQVTLRVSVSQGALLTQDDAVTDDHGYSYSFSIPRSRFDSGYTPKGEEKLGGSSSIASPTIQFKDTVIGFSIHVVGGRIAAKLETLHTYSALKATFEDATSTTVA
ncbi:hypothetical protein, partial [Sansalvadorimonas verongulae]|uniref:hypothetical protein n=1 Tax=Sansalvadorimonas verongulae TaxID=2172824 RepID=UPI001E47F86A